MGKTSKLAKLGIVMLGISLLLLQGCGGKDTITDYDGSQGTSVEQMIQDKLNSLAGDGTVADEGVAENTDGEKTAKDLIVQLGKDNVNENAAVEKSVFDFKTSLPKKRKIPALLVRRCLEEIMEAAAEMCARLVMFLPEEIAGDVSQRGFVITGGGANLLDAKRSVQNATGLPARVAENPEDCLARGLQRILNSQKTYQRLIEDEMEENRRA